MSTSTITTTSTLITTTTPTSTETTTPTPTSTTPVPQAPAKLTQRAASRNGNRTRAGCPRAVPPAARPRAPRRGVTVPAGPRPPPALSRPVSQQRLPARAAQAQRPALRKPGPTLLIALPPVALPRRAAPSAARAAGPVLVLPVVVAPPVAVLAAAAVVAVVEAVAVVADELPDQTLNPIFYCPLI